jgi:DNA-directed RNA polymerase subunit F
MVRKILEEKPIPLGRVHELLQIREQAGINYVQRVTAQHAEKLSKDAAYSEEILTALGTEFDIPRILAVQLVNINPQTHVDVRGVLGERLDADQIERFLEKYGEYVTQRLAATEPQPTEGVVIEDEIELEEGFEDL